MDARRVPGRLGSAQPRRRRRPLAAFGTAAALASVSFWAWPRAWAAVAPHKTGRSGPRHLASPAGGGFTLRPRRDRAGLVAVRDAASEAPTPPEGAPAAFSPCGPWCESARPVEFYALIEGYDWALWYHLDPRDCDCSGGAEDETPSARPLRAEWVRLAKPLEALPPEGFRRGVLESGLLQHEHTTSVEREMFDYRTFPAAVGEAVGEAAAAAGVRLAMGLLEGQGLEIYLDGQGLSLNYREGESEVRNHHVTHCWVEMNRFFGVATSPKSIAFYDGEEQFLHRG